jgi:hypothetical protein
MLIANGLATKIVEQAALNNALWCDTVCRTLDDPGEFHERIWLSRHGTPRYYPDAVTLRGGQSAPAQTEVVSALTQTPRRGGWSVKDSFGCLNLDRLGFEPLFDAEWISASSSVGATQWSGRNIHWT